jgi:hypothetical protein
MDTEIINHKHTHKYSLQAINNKNDDNAKLLRTRRKNLAYRESTLKDYVIHVTIK